MTARRWLLALVVATGLLAMHGITASAASAAAPCGALVPHEHHAVPSDAVPSDDLSSAQQASDVQPLSGHAGALCLAILVAGLAVGLLVRRAARTRQSGADGPIGLLVAVGGRAPPGTVLSLLCVSRT